VETVLVTGGNGFIGTYVVMHLIDRGYNVTVLDTRWREPLKFATMHGGYHEVQPELVLGDIRDATAVTEAVAHADGVIHLAGVLGTQETINNPRPAAETNILGGLNVLEAAAQYDIPMVNIAVGNYWMNNTYSITKNTVERFAEMLVRFRGARITTVRALNAYGPRQTAAEPYGPSKVRKVMPSFVCRALSGLDIEVYGDGEQIMDMIFVGDVANILVTALEHTAEHGPVRSVLEAGTGRETTVNDIADIVVDEVTKTTEMTPKLVHLPMRPGEDDRSVVLGNPATLDVIGIDTAAFIPLEVGVRETVQYFAQYLKER
jgi:UDP-glucose 4-epimerase